MPLTCFNERKFLIELIEMLRKNPCLWDTKSNEYNNKEEKSKAYSALLVKYREYYQCGSILDLKRKINILRTNYRRELKKVTDANQSSAGADNVYKPKLWYFKYMNFMSNQGLSADSFCMNDVSTEKFNYAESWHEETFVSSNLGAETCFQSLTDEQIQDTESWPEETFASSNLSTETCFQSLNDKQIQDLVSFACMKLQQQDEFMDQAVTWANDLRSLDWDQRRFAKKAINDILFEAEAGTLHRNSVKINQSSVPEVFELNET